MAHVGARRLWLPWQPRFRLTVAYPRGWHWVVVHLDRFDLWFTGRYRNRWYGWPLLAVVFLGFVAVRFLALVAVLEVTIIAFAASVYLVWGEWLALLLLFPALLIGRLVHLAPWRLAARDGRRRWTARVTGWQAGSQAASVADDALRAGREPPATVWSATPARSRLWV